MVKALPNTSFLPVPKSAPAGHTTAAAHLLWQVFPRYPCLEYKDNSGQSCPVRYTWTASFGCGLMFWQKWFYLTPQFVAYQFPGHLLHPHWYFTAYSSICQVLLGALNTPICTLLSCDPDLQQAIRMLPGQAGRFCRKYCLFIFTINSIVASIYLCSWQIVNGGLNFVHVGTLLIFALQSAILSVILEWKHPIRGWKTESDLWHHPRKYLVPLIMLLAAAFVGTWTLALWICAAVLLMECCVLLFVTRRG